MVEKDKPYRLTCMNNKSIFFYFESLPMMEDFARAFGQWSVGEKYNFETRCYDFCFFCW